MWRRRGPPTWRDGSDAAHVGAGRQRRDARREVASTSGRRPASRAPGRRRCPCRAAWRRAAIRRSSSAWRTTSGRRASTARAPGPGAPIICSVSRLTCAVRSGLIAFQVSAAIGRAKHHAAIRCTALWDRTPDITIGVFQFQRSRCGPAARFSAAATAARSAGARASRGRRGSRGRPATR